MANFVISPVVASDIPSIYQLASSWKLSNLDSTRDGFLVSSYTEAEYKDILEQENFFLKAEVNGELVAFLYGFKSSMIEPEAIVNSLVKYSLEGDFFLIKQICVDTGNPKARGVALALYDWVKAHESLPLAAAIVLEPENPRSIAFHEKNGFEKYFEIMAPKDPDGKSRPRGIWVYQDSDATSGVRNRFRWMKGMSVPEHLVEYYTAAVLLYTHEDNLNWAKLSMLVTFMLAMLATFPYVIRQDPTSLTTQAMVFVLVVFGFILINMFGQKIKSGIKYMANHKESVVNVEKVLTTSFNIPKILAKENKEISRQSRTVNIMTRLPLFCNAIWCVYGIMVGLHLIIGS